MTSFFKSIGIPGVTSTSATRGSLLERARDHDQAAWNELVDLYSPLIVRWCKRLRVSSDSTADCVQEVFAAVHRSLDTFHATGESGAFRGWLWTITRNKLRDAARRLREKPAQGGSTALVRLHEQPDESSLPDEDPSLDEDIHALTRRAMQQVRNDFEAGSWQAFWRSVVDGLPTDLVATELNISAAAVRQARSRILRRLRQQLGDL